MTSIEDGFLDLQHRTALDIKRDRERLHEELSKMKNRYTNRRGFSDEFAAGYQQGLAEAKAIIRGETLGPVGGAR